MNLLNAKTNQSKKQNNSGQVGRVFAQSLVGRVLQQC